MSLFPLRVSDQVIKAPPAPSEIPAASSWLPPAVHTGVLSAVLPVHCACVGMQESRLSMVNNDRNDPFLFVFRAGARDDLFMVHLFVCKIILLGQVFL
jgi:hypothetical protein